MLLANRRYAAAYYLCGYAVECAVKACIARQIRAREFPPDRNFSPDLFTHELPRLLRRARLDDELESEIKGDRDFGINWSIVENWSETTRYEIKNRREAVELFDAVSDPDHGVLQWLRRHW